MEKILWLSRYQPVDSQRAELRRMFGAEVVVDPCSESNAEAAAERFHAGGYRDLVAVVPLATLDHLCRQGLKPLWSDGVAEADATNVEYRGADGRGYRFAGFRRAAGVSLDLIPVEPRSDVRRVVRITRHSMQEAEFQELHRLFRVRRSDVVTREVAGRIDDRVVIDLARSERADEFVLVAPYSVYGDLCAKGKRPLYAVFTDGAFVSLHRVRGLTINFEEV